MVWPSCRRAGQGRSSHVPAAVVGGQRWTLHSATIASRRLPISLGIEHLPLSPERFLLQTLHLPPDSRVLAHQDREVRSVDRPGGNVGRVKVADGIHCEPSSRDSSDCASSTSRLAISSK